MRQVWSNNAATDERSRDARRMLRGSDLRWNALQIQRTKTSSVEAGEANGNSPVWLADDCRQADSRRDTSKTYRALVVSRETVVKKVARIATGVVVFAVALAVCVDILIATNLEA